MPTGLGDVEVGGDDPERVLREQRVEDRVRRVQHQLQGGLVDDLGGVEVDDLRELTARRERRLRVGHALDAEPGVLGRHGLAVVEGHPRTHLDGPRGRVARALDRLGQRGLELVVVVPEEQRLVEVAHPGDVGVGDRRVRVEGVLAAAAGGAVDQETAGALGSAAGAPGPSAPAVVASARGEEAAAGDGGGADAGVAEQLSAGHLIGAALVLVHVVTPLLRNANGRCDICNLEALGGGGQ